MNHAELAERIERAFADPVGAMDRDAVEAVIALLDRGEVRVAEPDGDGWRINEWAKKPALLYFRVRGLATT